VSVEWTVCSVPAELPQLNHRIEAWMLAYNLLAVLPMIALLAYAAAEDLRTRRIRNWLTLCLVVTGVAHSIASSHGPALGQSLLGLLAGFGLPLMLFILGALGGGDVKLLAGVGAWLGATSVIEVFLAAAVVGMVIVLMQCAWNGRLTSLFRNTYVLVISLLHLDKVGLEQMKLTGQSCRSVDRPLPYAVPVLIAVVLTVAMNSNGMLA
jgi:prepilin peptidase CpaA